MVAVTFAPGGIDGVRQSAQSIGRGSHGDGSAAHRERERSGRRDGLRGRILNRRQSVLAERAGGGAGGYDMNGVGTGLRRGIALRREHAVVGHLRGRGDRRVRNPLQRRLKRRELPVQGIQSRGPVLQSGQLTVELVQGKGGDRDGAAEHLLKIARVLTGGGRQSGGVELICLLLPSGAARGARRALRFAKQVWAALGRESAQIVQSIRLRPSGCFIAAASGAPAAPSWPAPGQPPRIAPGSAPWSGWPLR